MSALQNIASKIAKSAVGDQDVSDLTTTLVQLSSEVNDYLEKCGDPDEAAPTNPNQNPTAAEEKAWKDAWTLKCSAQQATHKHVDIMAKRLKREKRRNGEHIKRQEAESLAQSLIEHAKTQDMPEIAAAILDSRS